MSNTPKLKTLYRPTSHWCGQRTLKRLFFKVLYSTST